MDRLIKSLLTFLMLSLPVSADVLVDAKSTGREGFAFGVHECDEMELKAGALMRVLPVRGATFEETIDAAVCTSYKGELNAWTCAGVGVEISPRWTYYTGDAHHKPQCKRECPLGQFKGLISGQCRTECPKGEYLLPGGIPGLCGPKVQDNADPDQGFTCPATPLVGNPINAATGNKFQQENDFGILTRIPFSRSYNSAAIKADTGLGKGWRHNWQIRIVPVYESDDPNIAPRPDNVDPDFSWPVVTGGPAILRFYRLERADGASVSAYPTGELTSAVNQRHIQLVINQEGFTLSTPQTIEQFNTSGYLTSLQYIGGRSYTLSYQNDLLDQVSEVGSTYHLKFSYDPTTKRLTKVETSGKSAVAYGYSASGLLSSVTYPDMSQQQYRYDDANKLGLLTGLVDESQKRFATWIYDQHGRAIRSEHANGAEATSLNHRGRNHGAYHDGTITDVTMPSGAMHRYFFQKIGGTSVCQKQERGLGPNFPTSLIFSKQYDEKGNLIESTDASYIVNRYEYDPVRQLEIKRIESVGKPEQRIISTEWHATFELPTRITEPTRRSDFTYDGKGNLIAKSVTDLTSGISRNWRWSYDALNRIVEQADARGQVTRYTYDADGNLTTVSDAVGTIHYTQYNADGLPLSITSHDGMVTNMVYDQRGRLLSRKVGGLTTAYSYTITGLLSSVATPEGNQVIYSYDDAHRLVGIRDKLGNSIRYVLNTAGKRTREEIHDASGSLRAQAERIDAGLVVAVQPIPKAS